MGYSSVATRVAICALLLQVSAKGKTTPRARPVKRKIQYLNFVVLDLSLHNMAQVLVKCYRRERSTELNRRLSCHTREHARNQKLL
jgi:hypothetical protein